MSRYSLPGYDNWLTRDLPEMEADEDDDLHYCSRHRRTYEGDDCPWCEAEVDRYVDETELEGRT